MTKSNPPDELVLRCSCSRLGHVIGFTFFPTDPHDKGEFEAYVQVSLETYESFWQRLRVALRYLFKRTCGYGDAAEMLIKDHDLPKIRAWIERAEADATTRERHRQAVLAAQVLGGELKGSVEAKSGYFGALQTAADVAAIKNESK